MEKIFKNFQKFLIFFETRNDQKKIFYYYDKHSNQNIICKHSLKIH